MSARKYPEERFARYVQRKKDGCWLWKGCLNGKRGTGQFNSEGYTDTAQRYSWILRNGEPPRGMYVVRKCGTRTCVNPSHLELSETSGAPLPENPGGMGEKNGKATVSDSDVARCVAEAASGVPRRKLAVKYDVHVGTIGSWINGRFRQGCVLTGECV